MKLDIIARSKNDEFYTPKYAVAPIIKYIESSSIVWCPFDTNDSWFVKVLKENGMTVIATHIKDGFDFFEYEPENYDYIISNPPYSMKGEVLQRLFNLKVPFAMLLGVVGLFESQKRFDMFKDNQFEVMYLNRRVDYFKDYTEQKPSKSPPFQSVYICSKILPEQIVFEEINKKDIK